MNSRPYLITLFALFVIVSSCKNDDTEEPPPLTGQVAHISGTVTTATGQPVAGANVHVTYEGVQPVGPEAYVTFDVIEQSWVTLSLYTVRGVEAATILDDVLEAGRHRRPVNTRAVPSSTYELRIQQWTTTRDSLLSSDSRWLALNVTDPNVLVGVPPLATTGSDGRYDFFVAAGMSIVERNEQNQVIDTVILNRINIVAFHPAYAAAWQTVDVDSGQYLTVNLALDEESTLPPGLVIQLGDTTVIIPDSAQQYADSKWVLDAYLLREYQIASSDNYNIQPFTGTLSEWKTLEWSVRQEYLQNALGYQYDIMAASPSEHYIWIVQHLTQFGYGWKDTYPAHSNLNDPNAGHIWGQPSDPTNQPDDGATIAFDGTSHFAEHYQNMWIRIPG